MRARLVNSFAFSSRCWCCCCCTQASLIIPCDAYVHIIKSKWYARTSLFVALNFVNNFHLVRAGPVIRFACVSPWLIYSYMLNTTGKAPPIYNFKIHVNIHALLNTILKRCCCSYSCRCCCSRNRHRQGCFIGFVNLIMFTFLRFSFCLFACFSHSLVCAACMRARKLTCVV